MDWLGLGVSDVQGYHLFTDRYYNSAHLAQELDKQKCHTTGTTEASKKKVKLSLQQAMEALMAVRCRGPHIFWTTDSQMVVRLSALHASRPLTQEDSWYSFLLEAESTSRP
jgi:hypothetical protein